MTRDRPPTHGEVTLVSVFLDATLRLETRQQHLAAIAAAIERDRLNAGRRSSDSRAAV